MPRVRLLLLPGRIMSLSQLSLKSSTEIEGVRRGGGGVGRDASRACAEDDPPHSAADALLAAAADVEKEGKRSREKEAKRDFFGVEVTQLLFNDVREEEEEEDEEEAFGEMIGVEVMQLIMLLLEMLSLFEVFLFLVVVVVVVVVLAVLLETVAEATLDFGSWKNAAGEKAISWLI